MDQEDREPSDSGDNIDQPQNQPQNDPPQQETNIKPPALQPPQELKSKVEPKKDKETKDKEELWKAYDFLFPGGKLAKLVKIKNIYKKNLPYSDILNKLKLNEAFPVVNVIGAGPCNRGKFYAGVVRACFNTDAVIVDNGLSSGVEKFCLRRNVKLIGVAPQKQIKYPKINPTTVDNMELANGHSHLMLCNNPDGDLSWGGQVRFKMGLCKALSMGKKKGQPDCKVICLLAADMGPDVQDQVKIAVQQDYPIIVVPGSKLGQAIIRAKEGGEGEGGATQAVPQIFEKGHIFCCNSLNSEDIAQLVHFLLVVRPW